MAIAGSTAALVGHLDVLGWIVARLSLMAPDEDVAPVVQWPIELGAGAPAAVQAFMSALEKVAGDDVAREWIVHALPFLVAWLQRDPDFPWTAVFILSEISKPTRVLGYYPLRLLADALQRVFESASTLGSSMVVVDALDEAAARFYAAHGVVRLADSLRLVLPMRLATRSAEQ